MALRSRLRAIPWLVLWETARAVRYNASARVEDNLTGRERNHFRDLLRKSRGRRSNLSERERARLVLLFKKAVTGDAQSEWGQVARALPELIPREALAQYWEHRRRGHT
jgi:hypothetical protein